jgi:hypothetical protein
MALSVDNLGLGRLLLLELKTGTASKGRKGERSVATARLSFSSSMAENLSIRGHETRTYLCACHLGFLFSNNHKYMQEIKLQPFIQEVLQKNTYNSPRNKCANPSCNTFLQERNQNMPKIVFLQQVRLTRLAKTLE